MRTVIAAVLVSVLMISGASAQLIMDKRAPVPGFGYRDDGSVGFDRNSLKKIYPRSGLCPPGMLSLLRTRWAQDVRNCRRY